MYRKINDFIKDWEHETNSTIALFNNLTDQSLNQKVTDNGRSLGKIAWHMVVTTGEMISLTGLKGDFTSEESEVPKSKDEIISAIEKNSKELVNALSNSWKDENLEDEINMYGQNWTKGFTLNVLMKHLIHHRGQCTVLMRQAGLDVSGVCGPSKEEWQKMGMPPME